MRIIRTIESFYPYISGPANQAFMISSLLGKRGIESPIFTTDYMAGKSPKEETMENVAVRRFGISMRFMKYFYSPGFRDALRREKFDIIHAHNYRSYETDAAYRLAKKRDKPFVLHAHGSLLGYRFITEGISRMPYTTYDFLSRKKPAMNADAIIVSSAQEMKEALDFGIPEEKLHNIPMGIDMKKYYRPKEQEGDALRLLFVGRISRDRNLLPVLRALRLLQEKDPDNAKEIELSIVGGAAKRSSAEKDGYLDSLKDFAARNKLNVKFLGELKGQALVDEYRKAGAFIYTSLWENFGQSLLEAGATGLPIISTPVGIASDIVLENKTGYIVDFNDEKQIADKIERLKDRRVRLILGRNMASIIKKGFSWDDIIMEYEKVYLKIRNSD